MNKIIEEKIKGIYSLSHVDRRFKNKTDFNDGKIGSPVYGEITRKGVDLLVQFFNEHFNKETVFYDIGSGFSKMVFHIALQYNVKKSVGIEYSKERHEGAMFLKERYVNDVENVEIICGDFSKQDISDATVVYADNTVFSDELTKKLFDMLPIGCLFLFKRQTFAIKNNIKYSVDNDLVDRTYKQNSLCWLIKE